MGSGNMLGLDPSLEHAAAGALLPNQRLHLSPRLGQRGRDRFCYRFWLLAIQHSFRGAGEPRAVRRLSHAIPHSHSR